VFINHPVSSYTASPSRHRVVRQAREITFGRGASKMLEIQKVTQEPEDRDTDNPRDSNRTQNRNQTNLLAGCKPEKGPECEPRYQPCQPRR
jgi:hypothetical protein